MKISLKTCIILLAIFVFPAVTFAQVDTDNDGILDDGDLSSVVGDNNCTGGETENCDDNCLLQGNSNQEDSDSDGFGDICDECCDNPGDANGNGVVSILDITDLIAYLYKGGPIQLIPCLDEADPNGDCKINILDVIYYISYLYKQGPQPVCGCVNPQ